MTSQCGEYDHLNDSYTINLKLTIPELAQRVCSSNYGVHRLLSAIVVQRLERKADDKLALELKALLDSTLF